jgi:hypothetical protein
MNGIYSGVPMETYHSAKLCTGPSISSGGLRTIFNRSPAHYWTTSPYNQDRLEDQDESTALKFGRALHDLLFAHEQFKKLYVARPDTMPDEKTGEHKPFLLSRNVCKAWMQIQAKANRTVLTQLEYERLIGIGRALGQHDLVKRGALNGLIELSMVWQDAETGVWLKSRPDVIPTADLTFVDLKTTTDCRLPAIERAVANFGYTQQAALVAEACESLLGQPLKEFYLLFVEKEPPYSITTARIKDHEIVRGKRANRAALRRFASCYQAKQWPGPTDGQIFNIELPEWQQKTIDAQLEQMS